MDKMVSVILPNFNHAPYLGQRLESILGQTYQNFELIILDDCSTDNSLEVLGLYKDHPKVSQFIVNKKNTGSPFKQWRKGLTLAKGDIIWIAESDDYCDLNFLESQLNVLKNHDIMVSVARTIVVDQRGNHLKEAKHHIFNDEKQKNIVLSEDILRIPILNVSSTCFKKQVLNQEFFFSQFNIIGDRVFYQENFVNCLIEKNSQTQSYFRRIVTAVSNFENKSIQKKKCFFDENLKFIKHEYKLKHVNRVLHNQYLSKFFYKVRNRTNRKEKRSLSYALIFLKYKLFLKR